MLEDWLKTDSQPPRPERRTAQRLHEGLQRKGYAGAKYQFDGNHEVVVLGGVVQTVRVAHFRLCYSRTLFFRAFPRETQEMVLGAHDRAFAMYGPPLVVKV